ncbi:MAG TPA: DUF1569 domain-containing protein [Pyrinomonadaceae bacterium]|nr:DUF1569 domain-containing protein [Pyrinomonadaceae bacterium]
MRSILNEGDRAEISRRLRSLSASSTGKWGSMNVENMLQHLRLSASMALGELPVPSVNKRLFQMFPLKHLILYVFPFPKGAPTAPALKPSVATAFEEERAAVLELIERVAAGRSECESRAHPLFGPLTHKEWCAVTYKHTDHHLKQFGA